MRSDRYVVLRGLAKRWTDRGNESPLTGSASALDAGVALTEALDAIARLQPHHEPAKVDVAAELPAAVEASDDDTETPHRIESER